MDEEAAEDANNLTSQSTLSENEEEQIEGRDSVDMQEEESVNHNCPGQLSLSITNNDLPTSTSTNTNLSPLLASSTSDQQRTNLVSSIKTDTTASDLVTRPSVDSVDEDGSAEDVRGADYRMGTDSLNRTDEFSPFSRRRFLIGDDDELSEDNDNGAFEDNPLSSDDNNDLLSKNIDDDDEITTGNNGRLKYHITLTETESVFPQSFASNSVSMPQNPPGSFQMNDSCSLSRSGVSIASSLASFSGNLDGSMSADSTCLALNTEVDSEPAQYVLKMILAQFMSTVKFKIEELLLKDMQFNSCKSLQFGDDPVFDQLLESLYEVSEHSLPSILRGLFHWYDYMTSSQSRAHTLNWISSSTPFASSSSSVHQLVLDKRDLYVDFALGMGLLQACKQLEKHPVEEELLVRIESIAYKHYFKPSQKRRNAASKPTLFSLVNLVADLYAQLIGELLKTRFSSITTWFKAEFRALKKTEASNERTQAFVCLIMGLRFFRVKMFPIQEFDMSFQFIHELARYFQDPTLSKEKEIRHAFAGLLAEILLPVAAVVKNEVNIPAVKNLVKTYFDSTRQAAEKKKHAIAMFPLVTCLLAISHTNFFTQQWTSFTNVCLSSLRNKDTKISRAALESLYRLLWVYMVRIKEDNVITGQKLQPIIYNLFPKNSRNLNPRDMPLIIYVKIIHFIAQEKLDLAMREIIFELLQVPKLPKITITPERMIVGLRAFLVIADQLQQQPVEKSPPMPTSSGSLPSGSMQKAKRSFLGHNLTETAAMNCGLGSYFGPVCKALGAILYHLDSQIGKPMLTHVMSSSPTKDHRDISTALAAADKKPKLDLFRACVAVIPRLLPQPLSPSAGGGSSVGSGSISAPNDVLDLLCRLADHSEDELRALAISHIGNIIKELRDWRPDVISRLVMFIVREIPDTMPATLESLLRILLQLIAKWKECLQTEQHSFATALNSSTASATKTSPLIFTPSQNNDNPKSKSNSLKQEDAELCVGAVRKVEGLALCILSHLRPNTRRLAVLLLKEAHSLANDLRLTDSLGFVPCITKMDQGLPDILEEMLPQLSSNERFWAATAAQPDLNWLCEKTSSMWCVNASYDLPFEFVASSTLCSSSLLPSEDLSSSSGISLLKSTAVGIRNSFDPWFYCIIRLVDNPLFLKSPGCVEAVNNAWNFVNIRVNLMSTLIDQLTPQEFSKATLTRTPKRPNPINDYYLCVWRNYITLACGGWTCNSLKSDVLESSQSSPASADNLSVIPTAVNSSTKVEKRESIGHMMRNTIIPVLRGEHIHLKEVTVQAIGFSNSQALKDSVEDFSALVREATDRRPDKRRIKKRAEMRLMVVRIFAKISERGVISQCLFENTEKPSTSRSTNPGNPVAGFFYDLIDSYRQCLDQPNSEMSDSALREAKICFSKMIHFMIEAAPDVRSSRTFSSEIQRSLFESTSAWCGTLGRIANGKSPPSSEQPSYSEVELSALQAMCSVISSEPDERNAFLCEDSYIYTWLQYMLTSNCPQVYQLACGAIEKLFRKNPKNQVLLKWLISQSFELKSLSVSHACFKTLINVCSQMSHSTLHSLDINAASFVLLALFFADSSDLCIREKALQLLYLLGSKILSVIDVLATADTSPKHPHSGCLKTEILEEEFESFPLQEEGFAAFGMDESFLAATPAAYYKTQRHLSKELSRTRPELTLGILSEFSCRFEMTSSSGRETLLKCILPWMENIELVEPSFLPASIPITPINSSQHAAGVSSKSPPPSGMRGSNRSGGCRDPALHFTPLSWATGWGSTTTTDALINNLFYITVQFGSEHSDSLRKVWQNLCNSFHDNCAIILRFLLQMTAVSSRCCKLLAAAKSVVTFMAKGSKDHVISFLLSELFYIDAIPNSVRKNSSIPYFNVVSGSATGSSSHSRAKSDSTLVTQVASSLTAITTSTMPASSRNANLEESAAAGPGRSHRDKHSTLPPDFYQAPTTRPEKSVSVPTVSKSASQTSVSRSGELEGSTNRSETQSRHESASSRLNSPAAADNTSHSEDRRPDVRSTEAINSIQICERNRWLLAWKVSFNRCHERQAKPLPMPEQVFVCPLSRLILNPHSSNSSSQSQIDCSNSSSSYASGVYAMQRNFASLILCSHLLITDFGYDWTNHIPLFLHLSILGCDHGLPVVVTHSRRTLINLVLTQLETDADATSKTLLLKSTDLIGSTLLASHSHRAEECQQFEHNFSEIAEDDNPPARLAEYLLLNISQPLWTLEDVSPRNQNISSADKVSAFVALLVQLFENFFNGEVPLVYDVRCEWALLSLKMALSSSSRHYASRSFQVYRGLEIPPLASDVSEILMRLNDTVGETGEETQGYVVEILKTLCKVSGLIVQQPDIAPIRPYSLCTEKKMRLADLNQTTTTASKFVKLNQASNSRKNPSAVAAAILTSRKPTDLDVFYRRTCSYNGPAAEALRLGLDHVNTNTAERRPATKGDASKTFDSHDVRRRDLKARSQCLPRDFGDTLLSRRSTGAHGIFDDKLSMLCQVFWAVISVLESDFEYEYVLALKLLDQLLEGVKLSSRRHLNALCRVFHQMKWASFSGLQPLVLKGLTLPSALTLTNKILVKFTPYLSTVSFLDSNQRGLVVNILSLLPMLFESYDEPSEMLLDCADAIATECNKMAEAANNSCASRPNTSASVISVPAGVDEDTVSVTSSLNPTSAAAAAWNNLATVMRMFSRQSDVKDSVSWLAAVCQYLGDAVQSKLVSLITYLSELLERGPPSYQACLLHMVCNFIQIIDLQRVPKEKFNSTTVNTLLHRFMLQNSPEWKNALSALKLIVTRSSTLCSPSSSQRRVQQISSALEEAVIYRRQIPGRTLSFIYNFPVAPIGAQTSGNASSRDTKVSSSVQPNLGVTAVDEEPEKVTTPPRRKSSSDALEVASLSETQKQARPAALANLRSRTSVEINKQHNISSAKSVNAEQAANGVKKEGQSSAVSRSPSIALGRQISVGNASLAENQNSNWRRPFGSQRRVRDKLTGVIRSFGRTTAALARSPSIVFSSTTDVDFQVAVSAASNLITSFAGYESQIQSHPASSLGMGNGENTPAATTTGHGSIEDMNNIANMDLGTPSGREDTLSVDIFAHFDFLGEYDSDIGEGESNFQFGLRRPSDSSLAYVVDTQPAGQSQGVGKQLFGTTDTAGNSSRLDLDQSSKCSGSVPVRQPQVTISSEGVNMDSSDDEDDEDEEDDNNEDEDDDDDLDDADSSAADDDSPDELPVESSSEDINRQRSLSTSYSANHTSPSREVDSVRCLQPTAFLILSPQSEMIDIRLCTLDLGDLDLYWSEAVNEFLSPASSTLEDSTCSNILDSSRAVASARLCLENNNLIVNFVPAFYVFMLRYINDYCNLCQSALIESSSYFDMPELNVVVSAIKACSFTFQAAQKNIPVVLIGSNWTARVALDLNSRQRRTLDKNFKQIILESAEAIANLKSTRENYSMKLRQLRALQTSVDHVNLSVKKLTLDLLEELARMHMQITLLFNQIDKLYSLIFEANTQTSNHLNISEMSRSLGRFAEYLKGLGDNHSNSPATSRSTSISSSQDDPLSVVMNCLAKDSLQSQDFSSMLKIIRHYRFQSTRSYDYQLNREEESTEDIWGIDRLILIAIIWNVFVHKRSGPQGSELACSFLEEENVWLDQIELMGSNSARLRTELVSATQKSAESIQHKNSNTNSNLSNTDVAQNNKNHSDNRLFVQRGDPRTRTALESSSTSSRGADQNSLTVVSYL